MFVILKELVGLLLVGSDVFEWNLSHGNFAANVAFYTTGSGWLHCGAVRLVRHLFLDVIQLIVVALVLLDR